MYSLHSLPEFSDKELTMLQKLSFLGNRISQDDHTEITLKHLKRFCT